MGVIFEFTNCCKVLQLTGTSHKNIINESHRLLLTIVRKDSLPEFMISICYFTDYKIILLVIKELSPKFTTSPKGHLEIAR